MKPLSTPRLELQAAVMAAQIDETLRSEMKLSLIKSHFWVDSEIVLGYIFNETKRFNV